MDPFKMLKKEKENATKLDISVETTHNFKLRTRKKNFNPT